MRERCRKHGIVYGTYRVRDKEEEVDEKEAEVPESDQLLLTLN
jgi:hypothetical protein